MKRRFYILQRLADAQLFVERRQDGAVITIGNEVQCWRSADVERAWQTMRDNRLSDKVWEVKQLDIHSSISSIR